MSLAMKYSMKRKAKMSKGGMCPHGGPDMCEGGCYAEGGELFSGKNRVNHERGINKPLPTPTNVAAGKPYAHSEAGHQVRRGEAYQTHEGSLPYRAKLEGNAKEIHKKTLSEMKATPGPTTGKSGFAHGGKVSHEDMVDRIMHKYMSRGGEVTNDDEPMADFEDNSFDDLANRDGLEFSYTGANSGDELGDTDPDKEENDRVGRIMMKRKKQSNPRPA